MRSASIVMAATEQVVAAEIDAQRQRGLIDETITAAEAIASNGAIA